MTPNINKVLRQITELNNGQVSIKELKVKGSVIELKIDVENVGNVKEDETIILYEAEEHTLVKAKIKIIKDIAYWSKMKKRVRDRWARSFEQHSRSPKSGSTRASLRELALEEWKELEGRGYIITPNTSLNPWGLDITAPSESELIQLINSNN